MQAHPKHIESIIRTWVWLAIILGIILGKGFFAFWVVSDMGQPTWDYRPVADVPAQSAFAKYQLLPHSQHVRGRKGE